MSGAMSTMWSSCTDDNSITDIIEVLYKVRKLKHVILNPSMNYKNRSKVLMKFTII